MLESNGTYAYTTEDGRWSLTEVKMLDSEEPYVMYTVTLRDNPLGYDSITRHFPKPMDRDEALKMGQAALTKEWRKK